MNMKSIDSVFLQLPQGNVLAMDDDIGCIVRCHAGCLWVTEENLGRDFFLHPGHSFTIDQPGRTVITALSDSTCDVCDHESSAPQYPFFAIGPIKDFLRPNMAHRH
jgi:hypothetical protein